MNKRPLSRIPARYGVLGLFVCVLLSVSGAGISPASAGTKLKQEAPGLCFQCHPDLKESMSHASVHFPFRQGMCLSCHAVHAGDKKALVKGEVNALCLSCHSETKARLDRGGVHSALLQGKCTDCHFPHTGQFKNLLVAEQKDLCWNCHDRVKGQLENPMKHSPFEQGTCASCHDSHASAEPYLMVAKPNDLCQRCHKPGCNVEGVSITHTTGKMACTQCHTGHNSRVAGLFGPNGHAPFMAKSCESCHNPIKPGQKLTTWAKGRELCFGCHENDPSKFKEDDVHLSFSENPCALCHEYHASVKENLTVRESGVCFDCHGAIEKKIEVMKKALKRRVHREQECFNCHTPMHSRQPHYFKAEISSVCSECHAAQHRITHPLGEGTVDPRNGRVMTCISCHSLHEARADFMLQFDRRRQLCIQCHRA